MQWKGSMLCTHSKNLTLSESIYSMCLGALVTVWLCICTNRFKRKVSSGCIVRLPYWGPLVAFISSNRYLLAHQPTPQRPSLVHLCGSLSKIKASIDSLSLVKPLCGTGMVTTVLWINILARDLQGDTFKALMIILDCSFYKSLSDSPSILSHASFGLSVSVSFPPISLSLHSSLLPSVLYSPFPPLPNFYFISQLLNQEISIR